MKYVKADLRKVLGVRFVESRETTNVKSLDKWTIKLNKKVVDNVDSHCSQVYEKLGYIRLIYRNPRLFRLSQLGIHTMETT